MRRTRRHRLLGLVLTIYGLVGIALFVLVAAGLTRPLDRAQRLAASVEQQREAVVTSLEQAEDTIREMAEGVDRMDQSLGEAKAATDRAADISRGVAQSMFQMRDTVSAEIPFLGQPLVGLAPQGTWRQSAKRSTRTERTWSSPRTTWPRWPIRSPT